MPQLPSSVACSAASGSRPGFNIVSFDGLYFGAQWIAFALTLGGLALLAHDYATPWEWFHSDIVAADDRLARWRSAVALPSGPAAAEVVDGVRRHLADDLDAPGALRVVDRWVDQALRVGGGDETAPGVVADVCDALLGVLLRPPTRAFS